MACRVPGTTKSAGTINAALHEWWQELAQRLAAIVSRPELPAPLLEAADRLWEAALLQAHEALAQYRREADAKVEAPFIVMNVHSWGFYFPMFWIFPPARSDLHGGHAVHDV